MNDVLERDDFAYLLWDFRRACDPSQMRLYANIKAYIREHFVPRPVATQPQLPSEQPMHRKHDDHDHLARTGEPVYAQRPQRRITKPDGDEVIVYLAEGGDIKSVNLAGDQVVIPWGSLGEYQFALIGIEKDVAEISAAQEAARSH